MGVQRRRGKHDFVPATTAGHRFPQSNPLSKGDKLLVYDESADGSKQISDALATAKKEGKRVLLQFGANWCGWCLMLHKLFEMDNGIAQELKSDYVVVAIDVNQGHNKDVDAKYGHPTRFGLPVIVILDADGKQLTTKDTSRFVEGNHHNPDKVMAFLKEWSIEHP